jgi:AraC-like DNA-binding protein
MSDALRRVIAHHAGLHADADGLAETPVAGLSFMRQNAPGRILHSVYKPLICLVLQGAKQVMAGDQVLDFAAGQSLIVNIDIPAIGRITRATRLAPYLAIAFELDMAVIRSLLEETATFPAAVLAPQAPFFVQETDDGVLDCVTRLARLMDRPEAAAVLRDATVRELHYWLLTGQHGAVLRRLAPSDSHAQRIARAIALLRSEFRQPLRVERLAEAAGMSLSSFHQHFKALTAVSPLQFQKQMRLLEARRLMRAEAKTAAQAAFAVGYESASQFTREYGRMFGAPPKRDVLERRAAA